MDNPTAGSRKTHGQKQLWTTRFYDIAAEVENLLSDIKPVLKDIRPQWNLDELGTEKFSAGLMNHMIRVYQKEDASLDDGLVVRISRTTSGGASDYRIKELAAMQLAHAADCFPPVYAAFRNGCIYGYIPGRNISWLEISHPDMFPQFVTKIHKLHHVNVNSVTLGHQGGALPFTHDQKHLLPGDAFARVAGGAISRIPEKANDPGRDLELQEFLKELPRAQLREEMEYIRNYLNDLPIPMCFSHADLHASNIVFNKSANEFFFVDYEGAGMHNEYHDLSYVFCLLSFREHTRFDDPDYNSPAEKTKREFLVNYRDAGYTDGGKSPMEIPEKQRDIDLELLVIGHRITTICVEFLFMNHCVSLVNLQQRNMFQFYPLRKSTYFEGKTKLPALAQQYKKLFVECGIGKLDIT